MRIHRVSTLAAAGFLFLAAASTAAVPRVINYQARLTDSGGTPVKTAVTLTFTFWDAESGGAQLGGGYSDAKLVQPDANGVVSTQVGTDPGNPVPASVFAGASVWLNATLGRAEHHAAHAHHLGRDTPSALRTPTRRQMPLRLTGAGGGFRDKDDIDAKLNVEGAAYVIVR